MIECPECSSDIDVEEDELDEGETILCEECGRNFTVASVDPLELVEDESTSEDEDELDEELDEDEEDEEEEEEEEDDEDDWR
jgi:alpha-aminoadipate/glutamate carrier protein LysW